MDKVIKLLATALDPAATDPERLTAMSKIATDLKAKGIHASQLVISTGNGQMSGSSIDWEAVAEVQLSEIDRLHREISKLKAAHKRAAKPNDRRGWSSKVKANVVTDKDGYVVGSWS
ncbi:MAG: hypothetical protein Q7R40_19200 [Phaeospirillum sp.]|nr:hypothetical protein [Phaeospirillum sp.]